MNGGIGRSVSIPISCPAQPPSATRDDAVGGADGQQVEHAGLDGHDRRAAGHQQQQEREARD
jgi:hypothetical protein